MKCNRYRQYWQGEITGVEFEAHRQSCQQCHAAVELDALIEDEARALPVPQSAPGLWDRIATDIEQENQTRAPRRLQRGWRLPDLAGWPGWGHQPAWGLAAVLILAVGLSALLLLRPAGMGTRTDVGTEPRNLLTEQALARVKALEAQYEQAIGDLEELAEPVLASVDVELFLRYRERLETIDAQIQRCQSILARDGGNAHVRRYLLAAYQDKRETLTELLALAEG